MIQKKKSVVIIHVLWFCFVLIFFNLKCLRKAVITGCPWELGTKAHHSLKSVVLNSLLYKMAQYFIKPMDILHYALN